MLETNVIMHPPHRVGHKALMAIVRLPVCPTPVPKSSIEGHRKLKEAMTLFYGDP